MFYLNRLKPEFSRDKVGREPNERFAAECARLNRRPPTRLPPDWTTP